MLSFGLLGNKEHVSKALSFDCLICKLGKSKTLSFSFQGSHAENALILHIVMFGASWGISPMIYHAKYKYFVTFIDDFN